MLKLQDSMRKTIRRFESRNEVVKIFTCGPSVYARPHIGNHRTFVFEDMLVRYLRYKGFKVSRAMNLTDVEDKAIIMAESKGVTVFELTKMNERGLWAEWDRLLMERPDHVPRSSRSVRLSNELIKLLLRRGIAYWYRGDVFFDPLKFKGFGRLFGLDMSRWPEKKRRFSRDTYPGVQWNYGDFILWHGCEEEEKVCWDEELGNGRPSWNVQDAAMCWESLGTEIDIWCGGWDNIYRHHDYNIAVMEGAHDVILANYWLHGGYLLLDGRKMSKSKGNVKYLHDLEKRGYSGQEIRFYLLYGPWSKRRNMTDDDLRKNVNRLRILKEDIERISVANGNGGNRNVRIHMERLIPDFEERMDDNLDMKGAFDSIRGRVKRLAYHSEKGRVSEKESSEILSLIRRIDSIFDVILDKKM